MENIIELSNICKSFGAKDNRMQVLKDISPDSIIFAEADNNTVRFITSERAYKMRMKMTEAMVTLCTVLSDLLDNAIEAAGRTSTERIGTEKSM